MAADLVSGQHPQDVSGQLDRVFADRLGGFLLGVVGSVSDFHRIASRIPYSRSTAQSSPSPNRTVALGASPHAGRPTSPGTDQDKSPARVDASMLPS